MTLKNRTLVPIAERFIECAREAAKPTTARSPRSPEGDQFVTDPWPVSFRFPNCRLWAIVFAISVFAHR